MEKSKLFSKQFPFENVAVEVPKAIELIYSIPPEKYNSNVFRHLAVGFKSLVVAMEKDQNSQDIFPLFLKWFKLYVRLQHKIDSNDPLRFKFESKIPVCTSYILASLQYQNRIANYHQLVMEMCLMLFKSAQPFTMQNIANLDIGLISQLWMPVEFVGDYITQRLCLKLIVAVLTHLSAEERQNKVSDAKLERDIEHLILKLTAEPTNFEGVSRELLNVYNMTYSKNCTVFSIYCTKASFGSFELYKPNNVSNFWIDFNYTSKSVSLLCQLNQSERKQEEFYMKIKIDKLQIENQFDCTVYTIEQATFSTNVSATFSKQVSALLLSSRVAVFTLPRNQLDRLKANSDLIDYYNSFSYSESSDVSTPNTIAKYLAELSEDSSLVPCSEQNCGIPKMKSARIKIHKCDNEQRNNDLTKKQNHHEKNPTVDTSPLVSSGEYRPNYVGPSVKISSNESTTYETSLFKKPYAPIQFKARKKVQPGKKNMQNLPEKLSVHKGINISRKKDLHKPHREIINPSCSEKRTEMIPKNGTDQNDSLPMPIYKSHREQLHSERRKSTKLTRDEISYSFASIQVSKESFKSFSNVTQRQDVNNIQQKLLEESSLLEMSLQELGNASSSATSNPNEENITHKSIDEINLPFSEHKSAENVLEVHSKQPQALENPTPIQGSPKNSKFTDLSQCVDIQHQKPFSSKAITYSSCLNNSTTLNLNSSQFADNERETLSKHNESKIVSHSTNYSGKALQSSNSGENNQDKRKLISKNITAEVPKDKHLRFFKYKHLPSINSARRTTKTKRKTLTIKTNKIEIPPKSKSINFVKPLNYVPDLSLIMNEPVSESSKNENYKQIQNPLHEEHRADFLKQSNESEEAPNLIVVSDIEQDSTIKPMKRRTSKRKTLLKEVKASNFVPYSIWKIGQKEKNCDETVILSQKPTLQIDCTMTSSNDPFDKVKHSRTKNDSNSGNEMILKPRRRHSSSSSNSILTCFFPGSENEMKSAQRPCSLKKKPRNSLSTDIVRGYKSDDMIQSPIPIPSKFADRRSRSRSIESISTPMQMSLDSNSLDVLSPFQNPIKSASPVYEILVDEVPNDTVQNETSQPQNSLLEDYVEEIPRPTRHLSDSQDKNQHTSNSLDIPLALTSQQHLMSHNNNAESQFVDNLLKQTSAEERTSSSSRGSSISVYSDGEEEDFSNQIIIQNREASLRKRSHSIEDEEASLAKIASFTNCSPLKGYDRLLPEFIEKLTAEKNRILGNIKTKLNEDIYTDFNKTVEKVTKGIESHQIAIKEEQEKLISILENIKSHHQILQKNQLELEKIHSQIMECQKSWENKADKIDEMYKEAEESLLSYADALKRGQWHSFSKVIVDSLNERLTGLLNI